MRNQAHVQTASFALKNHPECQAAEQYFREQTIRKLTPGPFYGSPRVLATTLPPLLQIYDDRSGLPADSEQKKKK